MIIASDVVYIQKHPQPVWPGQPLPALDQRCPVGDIDCPANNLDALEPGPAKTIQIKQHASWGLLFLLVMLSRVYWRSMNQNPVLTYRIASWQKFAALFLHGTIYVVVITQSIIGLLSLCFSGNGIPFFTVFESQALMERNGILAGLSNRIHYVLSIVIYPLFVMHISAAIYHQLLGVPDD